MEARLRELWTTVKMQHMLPAKKYQNA